ncbi:MAG TPA: ribosomal protein S18-alanine N-acetyltransferase [Blastocatellia bacterium]|nr:ribosomal protein S18-alanine N-acetyltransferase [Blastocatellia bacterium]
MSVSDSENMEGAITFKPYVVGQMKESDLSEVVAIEDITGLNRWGYDAYRRELLKNHNSVMLVARSLASNRGGVVGFFAGWVIEDELHVNNIASHPEFRRLGIGQSLLEAGIDQGKQRGVAHVLLEVRASNEAAQSLYRKLGFNFVARRRDYYRLPVEDAFVMKLEIE